MEELTHLASFPVLHCLCRRGQELSNNVCYKTGARAAIWNEGVLAERKVNPARYSYDSVGYGKKSIRAESDLSLNVISSLLSPANY